MAATEAAAATPTRRKVDLECWLVGIAAAVLVLAYSLRNGLYDVVARGEFALLIWVVLGIGWATGVLPRWRPSRLLWPCLAGFALMGLWTLLCLSWTSSDERTVVELGRVAHHAGIFLLAASFVRRRTMAAVVAGIAAGSAIACWFGLCNWLWPGSITTDVVRTVFGSNRLSYPLDYWNGMAAFAAMAVVACLSIASHAESVTARAAFALPIPGIVLTAYLTYSRGGAFELALGLVVLLAFARHRIALLIVMLPLTVASALAILVVRDHRVLAQGTGSAGAGSVLAILIAGGAVAAVLAAALRMTDADERLRLPRHIARGGAIAGAVALAIAAAVAGPSVYEEVRDSFNRQLVSSAENPTARFTNLGGARKTQFEDAIESWKDHPVEGTGPGTYEFTWSRWPKYNAFVRDVHNVYLEALAESGVPGLLALLVMLGSAGVIAVIAAARADTPARRGAAAAGVAMFAIFLMAAGVDWVWELTVVTAVPLIAVGALAASIGPTRWPPAPRARRIARRSVVPVVALLAIAAVLPPVVSTSQIRKSQAAARADDFDRALRHADDAIDAAPWSASALAQKSLLLEEEGRLAEAEGYAVLAYEREPENWRRSLLRARLRAERGDARGAVEWYRRAKQLAPRNPALP